MGEVAYAQVAELSRQEMEGGCLHNHLSWKLKWRVGRLGCDLSMAGIRASRSKGLQYSSIYGRPVWPVLLERSSEATSKEPRKQCIRNSH